MSTKEMDKAIRLRAFSDDSIASIRQQIAELQGKLAAAKGDRQKHEDTIRSLRAAPDARVELHAVVMYLQKKYKVDIDWIMQDMLAGGRDQAIKDGAASIVYDGYRFLVRDGVVVSVL